ncbi:MAG: anthranilate synthase component I [Calditrichaeota bacterium]|nr:anthranilate synthase component I [Calditrichota bacterium]
MKFSSFQDFKNQYKKFPLLPVSVEILVDLETPVSTFLKCTEGRYRFLLESVEGGKTQGRFSIIGYSPFLIIKVKNGLIELTEGPREDTKSYRSEPLKVLKEIIQKYRHPKMSEVPFINGGLFGFLGYDAIRYIEKLPDSTNDDTGLADMHLFIPETIIVFDNLLHKIEIITFVSPGNKIEQEYQAAIETLEKIIKKINANRKENNEITSFHSNAFKSNLQDHEFKEMVLRAKKYIKRGDIFQVVLSQRLLIETQSNPFDIYRALRVINPSPYMFFLQMDGLNILGSSPETLIRLSNGRVLVKPIAGTRKRGTDEAEDEYLSKELLADPKEIAEHTMLVDLGRNDVGRIAEYGTVKVEKLMEIEKYSHVIHIVSTVTGKLKKGMDSVDVFIAGFPAGTVSGAPKVRAMEIIDELEPTRRGIYAGAVGYFGFDGDMDVCIAIRTIYMMGKTAYLQAGAGIVADSDPEKEYQETLSKAKGLMKAVIYAEGGL